jgi:hypothetical protein
LAVVTGQQVLTQKQQRQVPSVISVDPIYCFSANQIESRVNEVSHNIAQQLEENASNYIWSTFQSVEAVVSARLAAMKEFLKDYESR